MRRGVRFAMNIAICEDCAEDAAKTRALLEDYIEQNAYAGDISVFTNGEELLASFSHGKYDLIILDIYMGEMSGIDTAKKIRETDPTCAIIFITSSSSHALKSYSVRGGAYIVKPVNYENIQEALFTCRDIFMRNARYIKVRSDRSDVKLPLIKISYVEVSGNYALFHTLAGDFKTRMTLDEVEQQLRGAPFYRCHKSYLINANHIHKLDGFDVLMKNGDRIPVRSTERDKTRAEIATMLSARRFEV